MRNFFFKTRVQGVSLLELLLVFVVMAVIFFAAFSRFQLYERNKDLSVVKQNVNLLFQATQTYYHLCCSASQGIKTNAQCTSCNGNTFCVSTAALAHANLMPPLTNSGIANPDDYQVSARYIGKTITTNKPIYQLMVNASLNISPNNAPWYLQILQATSSTRNTLIWQKFPGYIVPSISDNLWIFGTELRQFKESNTSASGDDSCAY